MRRGDPKSLRVRLPHIFNRIFLDIVTGERVLVHDENRAALYDPTCDYALQVVIKTGFVRVVGRDNLKKWIP